MRIIYIFQYYKIYRNVFFDPSILKDSLLDVNKLKSFKIFKILPIKANPFPIKIRIKKIKKKPRNISINLDSPPRYPLSNRLDSTGRTPAIPARLTSLISHNQQPLPPLQSVTKHRRSPTDQPPSSPCLTIVLLHEGTVIISTPLPLPLLLPRRFSYNSIFTTV